MELRYSPDPVRFKRMTSQEVRDDFLIDDLFQSDVIMTVYSDIDRAIVGSAVPTVKPLSLSSADELRAEYFTQRRELGVLNVGRSGAVTVDGKLYNMANRDGLYIGRGSKEIIFASDDPAQPAQYYLLSYPAHKEYPTTQASKAEAAAVELGTVEQSNKRTIYKYIHPDGIKSCQLVMGFTELQPGCVWNTMPPHTHERRMEVYFYFDVDPESRVFHMMGQPGETRHIIVADRQAVISPSWSIHSGVGVGKYTFCWGMGGENQAFDDMDAIDIDQLR